MNGRIPQHFIDQLLTRVDIVPLIDARVPLKKTGANYSACCPFHNEKTPSFTVSPSKQFYHCFGCGAHGTAIGWLMEYDGLDFRAAVEELARQAGLPLPQTEGGIQPRPANVANDLYPIVAAAAAWFRQQLRNHPQAAQAVDYLRGRGLSGEIAQEYGLGYAPPGWDNLLRALGHNSEYRQALARAGLTIQRDGGGEYDRFRDRIIFPIRDSRGRAIAFGGRVLDDSKPKYLNSPETPLYNKGRELYGLYEARQALRQPPHLLLVEGYMDVIALAQFGLRQAVATLGTATTADHLQRLYRITPEVVFCFDGDSAGRQAARRALEQVLPFMGEGRQARFLFLPEGEDPDSLVRRIGPEGLTARIAEAPPLSEQLFQTLSEAIDIGSLDGGARLIELAQPLLAKVPRGVYHSMLVRELERRAQLPTGTLRRLSGERQLPSGVTNPRPAPQSSRNTLVRQLLRTLLAQPDWAQRVSDVPALVDAEIPGSELLAELLQLLQGEPGLGPAALQQRLVAHPAGVHLARLSGEALELPDAVLEAEFDAAILGLARRVADLRRRRRQTELAARGLGALSPEERAELSQLLRRQNG